MENVVILIYNRSDLNTTYNPPNVRRNLILDWQFRPSRDPKIFDGWETIHNFYNLYVFFSSTKCFLLILLLSNCHRDRTLTPSKESVLFSLAAKKTLDSISSWIIKLTNDGILTVCSLLPFGRRDETPSSDSMEGDRPWQSSPNDNTHRSRGRMTSITTERRGWGLPPGARAVFV